ncbi:hypothetical protein ACFE04_010126 [Oxalis oulophora]
MAEDPQKIKKIAAAAYDYENDSRWSDYWSNILIPPHMSSRSQLVVDHYKRKFYQRYIDPELVVEPMSTTTTTASSQRAKSTSSSAAAAATDDQPRPQNSGTNARTSPTSATAGSNPAPARWDRQTIQFSVNAWVFVVAVIAIFPLTPKSLSNRAFRLVFMGTASSSVYSLYSVYGKPRAWNLQALQVYFQSIIPTNDFMHFLYCTTFVTSPVCIKFALIPILCRAIEHVAKYLRRNFTHSNLYRKYLENVCVWVDSNTTTLNILSSQAEIGLGFLLIVSLLSWQRNILQTFMYWQLLKLMYHAPVSASYHQSAWTKIGRTVNPLIHHYAPFLDNTVATVQKWWLR